MVSIIKDRRKRREDVVRGKIKKKVKFTKIFLRNTKDKKANEKFKKSREKEDVAKWKRE